MKLEQPVLSPRYRDAVQAALALQLPIALLCLLMLDFGQLARICGMAMLAFWCVAAWVAATRPWTPSRGDLIYCRWGFVACFAFAMWMGGVIS
ncbi:MAG: hypothetical protein SH850_28225 [Planctomycetaceae bacterium]|nr:hypothetical protein [Planctomycetaceae bacterium]